jgi:endoglucanase
VPLIRIAVPAGSIALCLAGCSPETVIAVEKGPITGAPAVEAGVVETPTGYHTRGTSILDAANNVVYLKAINWYGLEGPTFTVHGLSARKMSSVLDEIKQLRFNAIRVTWSSALFDSKSMPSGIDFTLNPDLTGLTGPQIMDKLVVDAGTRDLKIILSRHHPTAQAQGPLWSDGTYPEARFIEDWKNVAGRYAGNPTVVGCDLQSDLRNPATWGDGNLQYDWRAAAERAGDAIIDANPDVLVIVEGIETFGSSSYWRGGNLQGVASSPVRLKRPGRLVYATQDFSRTVNNPPPGGVPWFSDPNYPKNLESVWDTNWGNVLKTGVPVFIASFGTPYIDDSDKKWLASLTAYIGNHDLNFAYWALNPESADTAGIIVGPQWDSENAELIAALGPVLSR